MVRGVGFVNCCWEGLCRILENMIKPEGGAAEEEEDEESKKRAASS